MSWWEGPLAGFDLETTSADPNEARVVTACLVRVEAGCEPAVRSWLIDPGVEIPDEAAQIHGITTSIARERGLPANEAIADLLHQLSELSGEVPVVAFNAQYDLTVMDREAKRHGFTLDEVYPVVDPYVLDKQMARFRRGSRKLGDVARIYGVELTDWHTAEADALAAVRIVQAMGRLAPFPGPLDLHERQIRWKWEQQQSLEDYFRRQGTLTEPVAKEWPVVPGEPAGEKE